MKRILKYPIVLLFSILVGTICLWLAFLLPKDRMYRNVRSSMEVFYTESVYPQQVPGYKSTQLDNETDAIMLLGAIFNDDSSSLEQAMKVARIDFTSEHSCCVDLIRYAWEQKTPDHVSEYTRYWHGYMIWLKPLLLLFDYADIRMMNMMIQVFLLFVLVKLLLERKLGRYLMPLALAVIVQNPTATAMSLQFSSIYYISIISMIVILKYHDYFIEKNMYSFFFFALGIVTVYFDFLTYPMTALCMPIVLVLILQKNKSDWLHQLFDTLIWGICFGLGYVGMWCGKWLISSLILGENVFREAINQMFLHTGDTVIEGNTITKMGAIFRNVKVLLKWPYAIALGGYFIFLCFSIDWKKAIKRIGDILPFVCVLLVPFAWLYFASSHSSWCYWYTYRGLVATVFGGFCLMKMLPQRKEND